MFSKTLNITIKLIDLLCSKSLYHFKTKEVFKKDTLMTYKILKKNCIHWFHYNFSHDICNYRR